MLNSNNDVFIYIWFPLIILYAGNSSGEKITDNSQSASGLDSLSKTQLSKLVDELLSKANGNDPQTRLQDCRHQFTVENNKIIRTRDSLDNGASFLVAIPHIDTAAACFQECCNYENAEELLQCDLSVFQQLPGNQESPQCFLFDCINEKNEFLCYFSEHSGYSAYKRLVVQETTTEVLPTTSATTTEASTSMLTQTTIEAAGKSYDTPSLILHNCSKYEWKCNDGVCISMFNVCNEIADCSDKSDEVECPSHTWKTQFDVKHVDSSTKTKPVQLSPTQFATSAAISSNVQKVTSEKVDNNIDNSASATVHPERGALLPLALGLAVTMCVLVMVVCRLKIMKKKFSKKPGPLLMDESDYLINGMYL